MRPLVCVLLLLCARGGAGMMPCESECAPSTDCTATFWAPAAVQSRVLSAGCEVVVYTISTEPATSRIVPGPRDTVGCNIAFVAAGSVVSPVGFTNWSIVFINTSTSAHQFENPRKASRVPKLSPGLFFAESVRYALYIDNVVTLRVPVWSLIADSAGPPGSGREVVMAALRHPFIDGMEQEVVLIKKMLRWRPHITHQYPILEEQFRNYSAYRAAHKGLTYNKFLEGSMLLHNLHSPLGHKWRCAWYEEYLRWADRDQISGCFLMAKHNYEAQQYSWSGPKARHASPLVDGFVPIYGSDVAPAAVFLFPRGQRNTLLKKDSGVVPKNH